MVFLKFSDILWFFRTLFTCGTVLHPRDRLQFAHKKGQETDSILFFIKQGGKTSFISTTLAPSDSLNKFSSSIPQDYLQIQLMALTLTFRYLFLWIIINHKNPLNALMD
ncbi:hypothetical protein [Gracilibacillus thailandensis]|uniref:Uncharacterized protein n=1 Tax=Gracilibacillus thailandensis TaxID=563735 RepID=A0A6N7QYH4_9BACI|nr:hypothetical protein [Gracilibacillus thailandensis]MRI65941.1 hypothetical protein [Gracilibacillus thailandensis]